MRKESTVNRDSVWDHLEDFIRQSRELSGPVLYSSQRCTSMLRQSICRHTQALVLSSHGSNLVKFLRQVSRECGVVQYGMRKYLMVRRSEFDSDHAKQLAVWFGLYLSLLFQFMQNETILCALLVLKIPTAGCSRCQFGIY